MSKLLKWLLIGFVLMDLGLGIFFLYQYGGLKYYIRALTAINKITPDTEKAKAWKYAFGKTENTYGGIYGGVLVGRVWVWGSGLIKSFAVDQYSIYSFTDGCSPVLTDITNGFEKIDLNKKIYFDLNVWRKKVSAGDLVAIIIAKDGTPGNLREIYTYNFWPFLQKDQKTLCAK